MSSHNAVLVDALLKLAKSDPANLRLESKLVHEIHICNRSKGYQNEDAAAVLGAFKFIIQNWDTCNTKVSGYSDLAMELGAGLCRLAALARDAEGFSKLFRNIQFVLSKCSKADQTLHTLSLLEAMVELSEMKYAEIAAISDCGKTIAFVLQSIGTYLTKRRQCINATERESLCLNLFIYMCNQRTTTLLRAGLSNDMASQISMFVLDAAIAWLSSIATAVASSIGGAAQGAKVLVALEAAETRGCMNQMAITLLEYLSNLKLDVFKFFDWALRWQRMSCDASSKASDNQVKDMWIKLSNDCASWTIKILDSSIALSSPTAEVLFVWLCELESNSNSINSDQAERNLAWKNFHKLLASSHSSNESTTMEHIEKFASLHVAKVDVKPRSKTDVVQRDINSGLEMPKAFLDFLDIHMKNESQVVPSRLAIQRDALSCQLLVFTNSAIDSVNGGELASANSLYKGTLAAVCDGFLERLESLNNSNTAIDFDGLFRILFAPLRHIALLVTGKISKYSEDCDALLQSPEFMNGICMPLVLLATNALGIYANVDVASIKTDDKSDIAASAASARVKGALLPLISRCISSSIFGLEQASQLTSGLRRFVSQSDGAACVTKVFTVEEFTATVYALAARCSKKYAESVDAIKSHQPSVPTKKTDGGKKKNASIETVTSNPSQLDPRTSPFTQLSLLSETLKLFSDPNVDNEGLIFKFTNMWGRFCVDILIAEIMAIQSGSHDISASDVAAITAICSKVAAVRPPTQFLLRALSTLPSATASLKCFESADSEDSTRRIKLLLALGMLFMTDSIASNYPSDPNIQTAIRSLALSNSSVVLATLVNSQETAHLQRVEWGKVSKSNTKTKIPSLQSVVESLVTKAPESASRLVIESIIYIVSSLIQDFTCQSRSTSAAINGCYVVSMIHNFVTLFQWRVQIFGSLSENSEESLASKACAPFALDSCLASLCNMLSSCTSMDTGIEGDFYGPFSGSVEMLFHILSAQGRYDLQATLLRQVAIRFGDDNSKEYLVAVHQLQMLYNGLVSPADIECSEEGTTLYKTKAFVLESNSLMGLCDNDLDQIGSIQCSSSKFLESPEVEFSSEEYLQYASETIEAISDLESKGTSRMNASQLTILKAWMHLCVAKCLMCCWSKYSTAIEWTKKAVLLSKTTDAARAGNLVIPAELLIAFEGMLLIGELHEHRGQLDKCYPYLADARSSAQNNCYGPHLLAVYTLHTCRIWQRTSSSRLEKALNQVHELQSDVVWCQDACNMLVSYLDVSPADGAFSELKLQSLCSFRHLRFAIDTAPINPKSYRFDCAMHPYLRNKLATYLASSIQSSSSENIITVSTIGGGGEPSQACTEGEILAASLSEAFDTIRIVHRRLCSDALITNCPFERLENNWYAFKSLVSSFNPSYDAEEGNSGISSHSHDKFKENVEKLFDAETQGYKLVGEEQEAGSALKSFNLSFNCVALDRSSNRLLIGRYSHAMGPSVIGLSVCDSMLNLISDWERLMSNNVEQLTVTLHADVSAWKDKEKKQWWDRRKGLDEEMQAFVDKISEVLGAWRFLFSSPSNNGAVEAKLQQILSEVPWDQYQPQNKAKKKAGSSKSDVAKQCPSCILSISPWIELVLSSMSSTTLDPPLSTKEAKVAIEALLNTQRSISGCEEAAESIVFKWNNAKDVTVEGSTKGGAAGNGDIDSLCEDLESLSVAELKSKLKALALPQAGKKAELIQRLQESSSEKLQANANSDPPKGHDSSCGDSSTTSHTVLMFDESLQSFPWENVSFLSQRQCSRSPNFNILLRILSNSVKPQSSGGIGGSQIERDPLRPLKSNFVNVLETSGKATKGSKKANGKLATNTESSLGPSIERLSSVGTLDRAWFCIDPEANLAKTRDLLSTFIAPLAKRWSWKGYAGECPPEATVRELHEDADLFVYSGHGAGERLMDFSRFKQMKRCPSAFLWGCSSGHLRRSGVHDPYGGAIAYLLGGASFVVGNLWDVTDGDIDKLSMHCMGSLFHTNVPEGLNDSGKKSAKSSAKDDANEWSDSSKPVVSEIDLANTHCDGQIAKAIVNARTVCKLRRAVGFAPVMYGIPVTISVPANV